MKLYRCGYCGQPCSENGEVLSLDEVKAKSNEEWSSAEQVHGECCVQEHEQQRFVTREMAMDAGIPEAEGMSY